MQKECNLYNVEANFKEYLESSSYSRTSVNNYLADFRTFLSWYIMKLKSQQLEFNIKYLTTPTLELYRDYLLAKNVPVKTINRHFSSLRTFIKLCIQENWIENNPLTLSKNIKTPLFSSFKGGLPSKVKTAGIFLLGFSSILLLFVIPSMILSFSRQNSSQNSLLLTRDFAANIRNKSASTSADLLTIPIVDEKGNLNLTASYPKIIGHNGTLSIEAPQLSLAAKEKGNITFLVTDGSIQFSFDGETPPLPYESAFYFSSKDIQQGTLIKGQTVNTGSSINLLELSSGLPAETKFKVDADGNVYIKGNIILDGNLIVNPSSNIFGQMASDTATSSYSPAP